MTPQSFSNASNLKLIQQFLDKYSIYENLPGLDQNSFLVFGKPASENLEKYLPVIKKTGNLTSATGLRVIASYIATCTKILLLFLIKLGSSLATPFEWCRIRPIDLGLKSLIVEVLPRFQNNMNWKGTYPKQLRDLTHRDSSLTLILNGTLIPSAIIHKQLVNSDMRFLVLPKTLNPVKTMRILTNDLKIAIRLSNLFLSRRLQDPTELFFVFELMKWQFRRATYANQVFKVELNNLLDLNPQLNFVLLTLEGHIHERELIRAVKCRALEAVIHGYVHAPILRVQPSLYENVRQLRSSDYVHLTGQIPKELLLEQISLDPSLIPALSICGSDKSEKGVNFKSRQNSKRSSILLAPEGTPAATKEMIELMDFLIRERHDLDFILRIHPALTNLKRVLRAFPNREKIEARISRNPLMVDLTNSICLIYRGSAVAIQGLAVGTFPIHFSRMKFESLDPIDPSRLNHATCFDCAEVIKEIDYLMSMTALEKESKQKEMALFARDYFSIPESI